VFPWGRLWEEYLCDGVLLRKHIRKNYKEVRCYQEKKRQEAKNVACIVGSFRGGFTVILQRVLESERKASNTPVRSVTG
jgi:hypothetical protein